VERVSISFESSIVLTFASQFGTRNRWYFAIIRAFLERVLIINIIIREKLRSRATKVTTII